MSTFKHGIIALPLALAAFTFAPAADNDTNPPRVNPPGVGTATNATAINTIDPVNGRPVDRSVETLRVSSTGQAGAAGSTAGTVVIGFSEKSSRDKVEKAQGKEKEMYITAAQQNRVVKDGRIGDGKAAHDEDRLRKNPADRNAPADRMDPANPAGPNQRGDGLNNDAEGTKPGLNPNPAEDTQPAR